MITFQISAKYFWGYRTKLQIDDCNTLEEFRKVTKL